jgi:hypothetical protein
MSKSPVANLHALQRRSRISKPNFIVMRSTLREFEVLGHRSSKVQSLR